MATDCVEDWEDNWENTDIPDLIVNLEKTIKNRERESEERKKMEEAEQTLAEDLFDKKQNKRIKDNLAPVNPIKFVKGKAKRVTNFTCP